MRHGIAKRARVELSDEGARRAAVAIVVAGGEAGRHEGGPYLLFVKRRVREGDPWSGHAAFPGGFRSNPSEAPRLTAQREAEEETGLSLKAAEFAGMLDDVFPRSVLLPPVIVTPCVFLIPERMPVAASEEIEEALWLRVAEVFEPENRRPFVLELPGGGREFSSIHAGGLVIWGLTERILAQLDALVVY